MSTRRTESGPRSNASALPPTLFRLPDLTQPAQNSPTPPAKATASPEISTGSQTNLVTAEVPVPSFSPAPTTVTSSTTLTPATAVNPNPQTSSPGFDRPAGRSWMDTLGSNKGIAVMIALVFIAAWWTSPNRNGTETGQPSDPSLVQQTPGSDELDLSVDLGNEASPTQAASGLASSPSQNAKPAPAASSFDATAFSPSANAPATKADAVVAMAPLSPTSSVASKSNASTTSVNTTAGMNPQVGSTTATPVSPNFKPELSAPIVSAATQPDAKIASNLVPKEGMPKQSVSKEQSFALATPDLSSFSTPATTISATTEVNPADDLKKMSLETSAAPAAANGPVSSTTPGAVDWSRYLLSN
jgi:hypothetical protein